MSDRITKKQGILLGCLAGDALGSPLDGMSRGHIRSNFKNLQGYMESEKALRNKMNRWKKAGLYSSISQMMLLLSMMIMLQKNRFQPALTECLSGLPMLDENKWSIFRHPGLLEQKVISRNNEVPGRVFDHSFDLTIRAAPITAPAIQLFDNSGQTSTIIPVISFFTQNPEAVAACLIFCQLLYSLTEDSHPLNNESDFISLVSNIIEQTVEMSERDSPVIFKHSINPESLILSVEQFRIIFEKLSKISDINKAEETIVNHINNEYQTHYSRATVDDPRCLLPFAVILCGKHLQDPHQAFFNAAGMGGTTTLLCSMVGEITGAMSGIDYIPETLINGLVNRKRIIKLITSIIQDDLREQLIDEFIASETSLTLKEIEEFKSKLKHKPVKTGKKPQPQKEQENKLSKHVIESWTKVDKARWKKEKNKYEKHKG